MAIRFSITLSNTPYVSPHKAILYLSKDIRSQFEAILEQIDSFEYFLQNKTQDHILVYLLRIKYLYHLLRSNNFHSHAQIQEIEYSKFNQQELIDFFSYLKRFPYNEENCFEFKNSLVFADLILKESFKLKLETNLKENDIPKCPPFNQIVLLKEAKSYLLFPNYDNHLWKKQIRSHSICKLTETNFTDFIASLSVEQLLNHVDISRQLEFLAKQFIPINKHLYFWIRNSVIYLYDSHGTVFTNPSEAFPSQVCHSKEALTHFISSQKSRPELLIHQRVLYDFVDMEEGSLHYNLDISGNDIQLDATVNFENRKLNPKALIPHLAKNIEYVKVSKNKLMPFTDNLRHDIEQFSRLNQAFPTENNKIRLSKAQFGLFRSFEQSSSLSLTYSQRYKEFLANFELGKANKEYCNYFFMGNLRTYQKEGLTWINSLHQNNFGAILADDMGLGKTIQVIAFLSQFKDQQSLVICPPTLLSNWQKEFERFAPKLTLSQEEIPKNGVFLTHFYRVKRLAKLFETHWDHVIIDEAQFLKNSQTQISKRIAQLDRSFSLCLSATPLENKHDDLWSLFNFILPQFLDAKTVFIRRYRKQVERYKKEGNYSAAEEINQELRERIRPFILRRQKNNPSVINDLPEKNENLLFCELSDEQKKLYQKILHEHESHFASMQREKSILKSKSILLTVILRLKQLCNHPRFFTEENQEIANRSPKLEQLRLLIEKQFSKHSKTVVFSQFSESCKLIFEYLNDELGFPCLLISGEQSLEERSKVVQQFQESPLPFTLVMSLKSGGLGLNLTAANTLVHFDRWWNPAVEDQASDRIHRIGQKEAVQIYKFLTLNTIEENIEKLIQSKKELFTSIISEDDASLSQSDLISILKAP